MASSCYYAQTKIDPPHVDRSISNFKQNCLKVEMYGQFFIGFASLLDEFNKVGNASDNMFPKRDMTTTTW